MLELVQPALIDLEACRAMGHDPHYVFNRGHASHVWLVAGGPIVPGQPIAWHQVDDGDYVLVPLVPYRAPTEPDLLFGFAWQLAALAMADLPPGAEPLQLQLALGRPAEDLRPGVDAFRVHAGLALRIPRSLPT